MLWPGATARADLIAPSGSFGSFEGPTSIAVDDAGRVYVADPTAGHVAVYDSATAGNRFLLSIGDGKLDKPVAVAVDNRQRVYVADAGRDVVARYDSASRRFAALGTLAGPGQAVGQLEAPSALATDPTQRLFVTEQGNLRVSIFRPARAGAVVFQSAFGISQPEPFLKPAAIARDSDGRLYVANADDAGPVRAFDRRGRYISALGGLPLAAPRGVAVDRFDRVAIADTGNDRLIVYGPLQAGAALLETAAVANPGALAFAPGALLYAVSGTRIVRLRFDDADVDGVADRGDNCVALANPDQDDVDADAKGDACDDDDDGDALLDKADECPTEAAGRNDADGCRDPQTQFIVPQSGRAYPASPSRLTGRSDGGQLGIARVEVALARRLDTRAPGAAAARCEFLDPAHGRFTARPCREPVWFEAEGAVTWRVRLPPGFLTSGRWVAMARARQVGGVLERGLRRGSSMRLFSVR